MSWFQHPTAVIDDGCTIGKGTKIWHFSHVMTGSDIGQNCSLGQNVFVANDVVIGDNVRIQNNVSVYHGVTVEKDAFLGPSCVFTNDFIPRSHSPVGPSGWLKTLVGEGASVGANATIVCGNTLGKHCLVGAGAVVTKDVPDYALVVGVPATLMGWICSCGQKMPDTERWAFLGPDYGQKTMTCGCGKRYIEKRVDLIEEI